MLVDAHHHLWQVSRGDYGWLDHAPAILNRDYLAGDLAPSLSRFGVGRTILVQAAQTTAEFDFLLEIAAENDFVAGVVGWLDFDSEDFPRQLATYRAMPKFAGLRPVLQDLDDDAWILRDRVVRHLRLLAAEDVPFDILTFPRHLPHILKALELAPGLRAVVDHLSKPAIASGGMGTWKDDIARVARFENVSCKISGMITEADPARWRVADLEPFVHHVAACFGPDRLMFGSDWPVCRIAGEYGDVLAAAQLALPPELRSDRRIFGDNALRFYKVSA